MKLSSVEVNEFECIRHSNPFQIAEITCLVGKNESGKTALLKALYRLNPFIPEHGKYDVTDNYPRADVEDYRQAVEANLAKPAIVVKAVFSLSREEVQSIEGKFGNGILKSPILTLEKGYENKPIIFLDIDESVAVRSLIDEAQLPSDLASELNSCTSLSDLSSAYQERKNPDEGEHLKRLKTLFDEINKAGGLILHIYKIYLEHLVPKFLYFDEYFLMRGHENIEALIDRVNKNALKESDYPLLGLIELARLDLKEILAPRRTEWLISKLEGASNYLSKRVLKYWSQNKHLLMRFEVRPARPEDPEDMRTGTNIWARIYDSKRMVSTPLGTRSRGFIWFFSFLAWFDKQQRKKEPLVLLLAHIMHKFPKEK